MALLPKKTYSRQNNEFSALSNKEKENIDPFDELLSSPPKHDVKFQPLSFWSKKGKHLEQKKKCRTVKCKLYETSDSDEHNSPFQRKRKCKLKYSVSESAVLHESKFKKFKTRQNFNYSSENSFVGKTKSHKCMVLNENKNFMHNKAFGKKTGSLNKVLSSSKNMKEMLQPAYKRSKNCKYSNSTLFEKIDINKNHYTGLHSVQSKKNDFEISKESVYYPSNLNLEKYEDCVTLVQQPNNDSNYKTLIFNEEPISNAKQCNESLEETSAPICKSFDNFKFISVKRYFNYPRILSLADETLDCSFNSVRSNKNSNSSQLCTTSKSSCHSITKSKTYEGDDITAKCMSVGEKLKSINECENFSKIELVHSCSEIINKTSCFINSSAVTTQEPEAVPIQKCQAENKFSNTFDFINIKNIKYEDLIPELLEQQNAKVKDNVTGELSSASDDTFSEPNDEDTVVEGNHICGQGFGSEDETIYPASPLNGVLQLTTEISDLTISNATDDEMSESATEKLGILQRDSKYTDKENTFLFDSRNVTTKRKEFLNNRYGGSLFKARQSSIATKNLQKENISEIEFGFDRTLDLSLAKDRMSSDWNKTVFFTDPIFESTRVVDMNRTDMKVAHEQTDLSKTIFEESAFDNKYALKPGKKWLRSISVLKQLQNGSILESGLKSTRVRGRKFESFVQDMLELQNATSKITNKTFAENCIQNSFSTGLNEQPSTLNLENMSENGSEIIEFFSLNDSVFIKSINITDKTGSEKLILNHTVKVIQSEEGSKAFRSALGLEGSHVLIRENSVQEESSCISAKNFILIQCGQEDVLPFEEYFNEKTLINCKKIGEGVYGEVFMCSNTVIKIIPINGSDKVNGEPQKTFEEIISEVVIASKLSNLRNGERNRTDGFSEMKRCWCVRGKYPDYLLNLWNEYDQLGSGSENDSPVMFKDDQLYIILELANGGKDLESFVFSSASQSLSIFIQAAFSLAVAEEAFEFEHRDLHWGNILISETKDKFMTVVLAGCEYKIPTKGVKVCIIDFTLSRISHEGCYIFNDLSVDPGLFASEGDYQFEIYRMMLREVKNDWSLFRPRNNLFWLHYVLDKTIKMVRYKNKKGKVHTKHLKDLKTLEATVLEYENSTNFVLSGSLRTVIGKM